MNENVENVIFCKSPLDRDFEEIYAVFNPYSDNSKKNTLEGYAHIGQHTEIHTDYIRESLIATYQEYKELYEELTNLIGYKLNVLNEDFEEYLKEKIKEELYNDIYITKDDCEDVHDSVENIINFCLKIRNL